MLTYLEKNICGHNVTLPNLTLRNTEQLNESYALWFTNCLSPMLKNKLSCQVN